MALARLPKELSRIQEKNMEPSDLDGDYVAVGYEVVAALDAEEALVAGGGVAATLDQLLPADRFGFDEGFHDLGVDRAGGFERGRAAMEGAGDGLLALAG